MTTNQQATLRIILETLSQAAASVPWHVVAVDSCGLVALVDLSDDAPHTIAEAVAGRWGDVVATATLETATATAWGCLVKPAGDVQQTADRLRAAYALAIDAGGDEGPF
ncbi:hypothetical protein [Crateriforma spongiae]|uniref:hypothetical protein n=1 Tax=Crateriforma spongiae TaxID=2724528 RepID=UPI001445A648|nr:hypothetical protein [Crateriforma spongiae]